MATAQLKSYDPQEARDDAGKWTSGGGTFTGTLRAHGFTEGAQIAKPEERARPNRNRGFITGYATPQSNKTGRTRHENKDDNNSFVLVYPDGTWEHKKKNDDDTSVRLKAGKGSQELNSYLSNTTKASNAPTHTVSGYASGRRQGIETGRWVTAGGRRIFIAPKENSIHDYIDVYDPSSVRRAGNETQGSRVMNFSNGGGTQADQHVRFVTNTDADGKFKSGTLRVEITPPFLPRKIYERPMAELPKLIGQLLGKSYEAVTQYSRDPRRTAKAMVKANPNHDEQGRFTSTGAGGQSEENKVPSMVARARSEVVFQRAAKERGYYGDTKPTDPAQATAQRRQISLNLKRAEARAQTLTEAYHQDGYDFKSAFVKAYDPQEERDNAGKWTAGGGASAQPADGVPLTHAEMTGIVKGIAGKLGINADRVEMAETDAPANANGDLVGEYNSNSGNVTVYPTGFKNGAEELTGTVAHEGMHLKLDTVMQEYNKEMKLRRAGEGYNSGKLEVLKDLEEYLTSRQGEVAKADGQSDYSKLFWDKHQANPTQANYIKAFSETLSEVERLKATGGGSGVNNLWNFIATRVNRHAKELGA